MNIEITHHRRQVRGVVPMTRRPLLWAIVAVLIVLALLLAWIWCGDRPPALGDPQTPAATTATALPDPTLCEVCPDEMEPITDGSPAWHPTRGVEGRTGV